MAGVSSQFIERWSKNYNVIFCDFWLFMVLTFWERKKEIMFNFAMIILPGVKLQNYSDSNFLCNNRL